MLLSLIVSIFTVANAFIALFIVIYAFLFLNKTKSHRERRPWDYLFLASIIYLGYTLFWMLLKIYDINILFNLFDLYEVSVFFQFVYTGLILLSFISQTDLIFNNDIIIIMKKHTDQEEAQKLTQIAAQLKEKEQSDIQITSLNVSSENTELSKSIKKSRSSKKKSNRKNK